MTPKQEEALRDYLQEVIVPLIEEVLVKKLGQAMTFAKEELPKPAQQEPVAWYRDEDGIRIYYESKVWDDATPLYTFSPAQRAWVGLTDEELSEVYNQADWDTVKGWEYERAIEAKLKEKNT